VHAALGRNLRKCLAGFREDRFVARQVCNPAQRYIAVRRTQFNSVTRAPEYVRSGD
jgi:hypothetical protein